MSNAYNTCIFLNLQTKITLYNQPRLLIDNNNKNNNSFKQGVKKLMSQIRLYDTDNKSLSFSINIATKLGLEKALILQQIHDLNTRPTYAESITMRKRTGFFRLLLNRMPFFSRYTVHIRIKSLRERGILEKSDPASHESYYVINQKNFDNTMSKNSKQGEGNEE